MRITEHTVSYSRKIQLQQFEPVEMGESVTVELEEGDDLTDVSDELDNLLRTNVERRLLDRVLEAKMEDEEDGE